MIQRVVAGLLATAAFTVIPAAAASAYKPELPKGETLPRDCPDLQLCDITEECLENDENFEGRICSPYSWSELIAYGVYTAEQIPVP